MLNLTKRPVTSTQLLLSLVLITLGCWTLAQGQDITIIGPTIAEVRQPVQFNILGLPDKAAIKWRVAPKCDSDVWLEMYDRNGVPINIYWSLEPGLKTIELIAAVNGKDIPTISIVSHQLKYGSTPGPLPVPVPVPVPEPSIELQAVVQPITSYRNPITDLDRTNLVSFYGDFAEVLASETGPMTVSQLKDSYNKAGKLFFENTGIKGKYAGLPEIIDGILASSLGLEANKVLDLTKTSELFKALSWAFWKGGQS